MCLNENLEIYIKHLTLVISRYIDSYEKNDHKSLEIIEKEEQESKTLLCYETLINKCYASLNDAAKSEIIQAFRRSYPGSSKSDEEIIYDDITNGITIGITIELDSIECSETCF